MATKKKTSTASKYSADTYFEHARKSGVALKVSTTKNSGVYGINFILKTGADAVMSALFLIASGFKAVESVASAELVNAISTLESNWDGKEGNVLNEFVKRVNAARKKAGKKPFNNYKTLTRRIRKEVDNGGILTFAPKTGIDDVKALLASVK